MSIMHDIDDWLHPRDKYAVPTPGFPSGDSFITWIEQQPLEDAFHALIDVLRNDTYPQQYMAMAALRALGFAVWGDGYQSDFVWNITIVPAHK